MKSHLEASFDLWLKTEGIPEPEREYRFAPPRRWRFDYAWPARKVAVEIDGMGPGGQGRHQRYDGFIKDAEKHEAAIVANWTVYHVPGVWVMQGNREVWRPQVMETLRKLLGIL